MAGERKSTPRASCMSDGGRYGSLTIRSQAVLPRRVVRPPLLLRVLRLIRRRRELIGARVVLVLRRGVGHRVRRQWRRFLVLDGRRDRTGRLALDARPSCIPSVDAAALAVSLEHAGQMLIERADVTVVSLLLEVIRRWWRGIRMLRRERDRRLPGHRLPKARVLIRSRRRPLLRRERRSRNDLAVRADAEPVARSGYDLLISYRRDESAWRVLPLDVRVRLLALRLRLRRLPPSLLLLLRMLCSSVRRSRRISSLHRRLLLPLHPRVSTRIGRTMRRDLAHERRRLLRERTRRLLDWPA